MATCNDKPELLKQKQTALYMLLTITAEKSMLVNRYQRLTGEDIESEMKFFALLTEAARESFPPLKHTPGQLVGQRAEPI